MPRVIKRTKSTIAKSKNRNKKSQPSKGRANTLSHEKRMTGYGKGRAGRGGRY